MSKGVDADIMTDLRRTEALGTPPTEHQLGFVSDLLHRLAPDLHEMIMGYRRDGNGDAGPGSADLHH